MIGVTAIHAVAEPDGYDTSPAPGTMSPENGVRRLSAHDTRHFRVLYAGQAARVVELGDLLDSFYDRYFDLCHDAGLATWKPGSPLTWRYFDSAEAWRQHLPEADGALPSLRSGYYCTHSDAVVLLHPYDASCDEPNAWPDVRIAHEAAHQLAYNTGLQTRGVMYPVWLSEGLATQFETAGGFTGDNAARRIRLAAAHRDGRLLSIEDLIVLDRVPADEDSSLDLYAQAWGLVRFLFERDDQTFRRYLYTIAKRPQGRRPDAALRNEFTRMFGSPDSLQEAWTEYLSRIALASVAGG